MGQAKNRGTKEDRLQRALGAIEALRPEFAECGKCKTEVRELELFDSRNLLAGLKAVFGGVCGRCGSAVWTFAGEEEAVKQAALMMRIAADEEGGNSRTPASDE